MVHQRDMRTMRSRTSIRDRIANSPLRVVDAYIQQIKPTETVVETETVAAVATPPRDDVCAVHHRYLSYYEMMDGKRCRWCAEGLVIGSRDDTVVQGTKKGR